MARTLRDIELTTGDGVALAASLAMPPGGAETAIVIAPALAVPRRLYASFSRFLADRGFAVLSFDHRGFGGSGPAWRAEAAGGLDSLGRLDLDAALRHAAALPGIRQVQLVAHSFGLMLFALAPSRHLVLRAVSVASGTPHHRFQPFPRNLLHLFLWSVVVPRSARVHGYFPGRAIGLVGDMPVAVARDIALACRRRGAFVPRASDWAGALFATGFSDDDIAPPAAVTDLHRGFPCAALHLAHLTPAAIGMAHTGHYGAFLPSARDYWTQVAEWLRPGAGAQAA
jgi:predicted alpha/beta hydrolase